MQLCPGNVCQAALSGDFQVLELRDQQTDRVHACPREQTCRLWASRSAHEAAGSFRAKPRASLGQENIVHHHKSFSGQTQMPSQGVSKAQEVTVNTLAFSGDGMGDPTNAYVSLIDVPKSPHTHTHHGAPLAGPGSTVKITTVSTRKACRPTATPDSRAGNPGEGRKQNQVVDGGRAVPTVSRGPCDLHTDARSVRVSQCPPREEAVHATQGLPVLLTTSHNRESHASL